jgi:hypothetical protein
MRSDEVVTKRDNDAIPPVVLRAALGRFIACCSAESLASVYAAVAALPEAHRVQEDVDLLVGDRRENR